MIRTTTDIDHLNTVFISNLPYNADESAIRQVLSSAGEIRDIRLVKHEWSGKSKGFAYVDFLTSESYRQALKLDHTLINDRPIYINAYDPNKSSLNEIGKNFKYATTLERNKLFLSNLPFSITKERLEKLFQEKGFQIKDVRLVTHKSGKPKGLAYVEFDEAQEASKAVFELNGIEIDQHAIHFAVSNPPQRKEPKKLTSLAKSIVARATSLGERPKSAGPRGKGRSQIALVPRNIGTTSRTSENQSISITTNQMSNDDFKKLFLDKK